MYVGSTFTSSGIYAGSSPDFSVEYAIGTYHSINEYYVLARYIPTSLGPAYGYASNGSSICLLVGTGTAYNAANAKMSASANPFSFGSGKVGVPVTLAETISNTGTTILNLTATISGPNASDFTLSGPYPALYPANDSVPFGTLHQVTEPTVNFTASGLGARSATLTLTDSPSGNFVNIPLTGTGVYGGPTVTPTTLAFGNVPVGSTSTPQTITITADFDDPIFLFYTAGYVFPAGNSCPQTPCTLTVAFAPTIAGSQPESILVADTAGTGLGDNASYVSLTGGGGSAVLAFSPNPETFALRSVGTTSIPVTITVTASGGVNVPISSVGLTGTNAGDYIVQSNGCSGTLTQGSSCSITLSFAPMAAGTRTANLQIVSTAGTSLLALSGTAQ